MGKEQADIPGCTNSAYPQEGKYGIEENHDRDISRFTLHLDRHAGWAVLVRLILVTTGFLSNQSAKNC